MKPTRFLLWTLLSLLLAGAIAAPTVAQDRKLRFGVGPLPPTPTETKKAFEPFEQIYGSRGEAA